MLAARKVISLYFIRIQKQICPRPLGLTDANNCSSRCKVSKNFHWSEFLHPFDLSLWCIILFVFCSLLECSNYRILREYDRAQGYRGVVKCDRSLAKAWYRFQGGAGKQMPTKCVPKHQCGTHAPGWLTGGHPTAAQGIVSRKVCFHWSSGCCQWSQYIRVRNCGRFYVYELPPTRYCNLRYCGDRGQGIVSLSVSLYSVWAQSAICFS